MALVSTIVGCGEGSYMYRPARNASATASGSWAARYPIPETGPKSGEVLVESIGVTEITVVDAPTRVLFVRMTVSNDGDDTPWSVDTRRQIAWIAGRRETPTYVNPYQQPLPVIHVARGERRTIDLYYRVGEELESNDEVPRFDVAWDIDTGNDRVADRTTFHRLPRPRYAYGYDPYDAYGPGWAPYGWYGAGWGSTYYRSYGLGYGLGYGPYGYGGFVGGGHF